jgi:hypothetical protein
MSIPIIGTWAFLKVWSATARRTGRGGGKGIGEEGGGLARTEQWILVRRRHNLEFPRLGVITEPSPPTTLYASGGRIKLLLERIDRAKVALKRGFQLAVFELAATLLGGREVPPEEGVVDVALGRSIRSAGEQANDDGGCWRDLDHILTSAVELERGLESDPLARRRRLDVCLLCCVEASHVGLMVLRMMEHHDFGRDVGLQGLGFLWPSQSRSARLAKV